jgi:hypothetical protein
MKQQKTLFISLSLIILLHFSAVEGQEAGARFLLWKPSAVSMSQGGTGVARGDDAFSLWHNPALLSSLYTINGVGSFVEPLRSPDNVTHFFLALSFPLADDQILAFSANIFQLDDQPFLFYANSVVASEYAYHPKISYAYTLRDNFSLGVNLGMFCYKPVGADRVRRLTADLGISITNLLDRLTIRLDDVSFLPVQSFMPRPDPAGINFGLSLTNLGTDLKVEGQQESRPMPSVLLAGISYVLLSSNYLSLILNGDLENQLHEESFAQYLNTGAEIRVYNVLSLRGGRVNAVDDQFESFNTFGFGFHLRYFSLNFARYDAASGPVWHYDAAFHIEF